jgi:hypothetical protein
MRLLTTLLVLSIAMSGNAWAIGAIAVDDEAGSHDVGYGFVTGYSNKHEAIAAAIRECKAHGNTDCKSTIWFKNCGAYAVSENYYGTGWGDTARDAERMAHDSCGHNCRIVISECE